MAARLRERGLIRAEETPEFHPLTGGVSGDVLLVETPSRRVVVKRALPRLRVAAHWVAKAERALTEAAALEVLHAITPSHTPELLDIDTHTLSFTMTAAPVSWVNWKNVLLELDPAKDDEILHTARGLGGILGSWHLTTHNSAAIAESFDDYETFEQLRVGAFHRPVAARHPELAEPVNRCIQHLITTRECLVHGDFSPKNVLVGEGLWVLDFEVAHYGASVFDIAFLHSHLMLKAIHRPDRAGLLHSAGEQMMDAYLRLAPPDLELATAGAHAACLLLARVQGTSPVDYLPPRAADEVVKLASGILLSSNTGLAAAWDHVLAICNGIGE